MSENDIIAEYVKEQFPEILKTFDFAFYRLCIRGREVTAALENEVEKTALFLQKVFNTKNSPKS